MSGRGRGRGRGRGGRGGRSDRASSNQSGGRDKTTPKERKVLADHIYYVGSAKQASDFFVFTDFIINHIRQKFDHGNDIANALETPQRIDCTTLMPKLSISSASGDDEIRENKEFEFLYEAEISTIC